MPNAPAPIWIKSLNSVYGICNVSAWHFWHVSLTMDDFASPRLMLFRSIKESCFAHMSFSRAITRRYTRKPTLSIIMNMIPTPTHIPTIAEVGIPLLSTLRTAASVDTTTSAGGFTIEGESTCTCYHFTYNHTWHSQHKVRSSVLLVHFELLWPLFYWRLLHLHCQLLEATLVRPQWHWNFQVR